MSIFKEITNKLKNTVYCCSKPDGEGLVDKEECPCFSNGRKFDCVAKTDRDRFHSRYKVLESDGFNHNEIHSLLKKEFDGSQWYHANVKHYRKEYKDE